MPKPDAAEAEVVPKDPELPESIVRKMYIRKTDITEFRETPGCIGCRCAVLGKPLRSHTVERIEGRRKRKSRERIEGGLRETEEGRQRLAKADDRVTEASAKSLLPLPASAVTAPVATTTIRTLLLYVSATATSDPSMEKETP